MRVHCKDQCKINLQTVILFKKIAFLEEWCNGKVEMNRSKAGGWWVGCGWGGGASLLTSYWDFFLRVCESSCYICTQTIHLTGRQQVVMAHLIFTYVVHSSKQNKNWLLLIFKNHISPKIHIKRVASQISLATEDPIFVFFPGTSWAYKGQRHSWSCNLINF